MSVTKDGDTGRWMSQIRVTDWTGKTIHKKKRGFATKKEALQWERDFISQSTGSLGMTFGDFISLYVKDMEHRLKPSTVASKKWLIDLKVTPFFKKIPLNEIKPTHVRQWQNSLTSYRDENGRPYDLSQVHQQPAHGDFQLRSQILWAERKSLPQGGEHGQEESR